MDETREPTDAFYFGLALCLGLTAGLIGTAFHLTVDGLLHIAPGLRKDGTPLSLLLPASMILAALAALASATIVRKVAPEAAGSGIQEIEGAMEGLRPMRAARVLVAKFFGGALSLGAGLVLGREGPTIHMGAASAAAISERFNLDKRDRKGLLAAGAAAGLAAAFNAPLAAILFIVEETRRQFPYGYRTYVAVITASAASAVVTEWIAGVGPSLVISASTVPVYLLPGFIMLGVMLGGLGVFFNRALVATLDAFANLPPGRWWLPATAIGAVSGALMILAPDATKGGETLIESLAAARHGFFLLIGLTMLRFAGVMISYASGVPGGIFAPMLSIATCFGLAGGTALAFVLPDAGELPKAFAIAAMGGLFAASVRAPMVGVVLVLELTGAYELLLPVLITCACATVFAEKLGGRPIYEVLLERTLAKAGIAGPPEVEKSPVIPGFDDTTK
ncbi:H(+)/Cl(-) exchange transporter ClcA [Stappia sp. GBMRC 2046]|uniref:H(+)/Cl(-) exchange transporter ClcA n=1 Tax=Stappia sediminis TaxID=2692190 RepID=A0A7X3LW64_9HYPH|nr:H(+)/Cl(-) exchange transporter ClcA [Stappia sediminis]MXN66190.1 H(+)/Cl(-) exchange transporter ClcA [Stappia sediminis]